MHTHIISEWASAYSGEWMYEVVVYNWIWLKSVIFNGSVKNSESVEIVEFVIVTQKKSKAKK